MVKIDGSKTEQNPGVDLIDTYVFKELLYAGKIDVSDPQAIMDRLDYIKVYRNGCYVFIKISDNLIVVVQDVQYYDIYKTYGPDVDRMIAKAKMTKKILKYLNNRVQDRCSRIDYCKKDAEVPTNINFCPKNPPVKREKKQVCREKLCQPVYDSISYQFNNEYNHRYRESRDSVMNGCC